MRACVDAGFQPRVVQEITDPYMILILFAAGVGIALTTESMTQVLPRGAHYVPLNQPGAEITYPWRRARRRPDAVEDLSDPCAEHRAAVVDDD